MVLGLDAFDYVPEFYFNFGIPFCGCLVLENFFLYFEHL